MAKNLVIVESPAKAKTIEKFLGKDFIVRSSFGHIRDLSKKDISIDIENDFEPNYIISDEKNKIVSELKKEALSADMVWLASDEDREGEAIAWHLKEALGLESDKIKRIVFNEITQSAILHAVENPRQIDINLVNAQQARRILDRIVGYEISPVLWKKVKPALSAGRVQSVAVRLIVEREQEIKQFIPVITYKVNANFGIKTGSKTLNATLNKRFETKEDAISFLKDCIGSSFSVDAIEKKPAKQSPAPPFTTSTLQQEASRKLGFSVSKTMMVAQQLYEAGYITYMRTDSVNLSDLALNASKKEIETLYGQEYVETRKYSTKSKGAQEAHEAIRPTYMSNKEVKAESDGRRLYELIWKRTIASQMSDAKLERTTVEIDISKRDEKFVTQGEVILFDGFLKVYSVSNDEDIEKEENNTIPNIKKGDILELIMAKATQSYSQQPARYNEASLVKKLEDLGIGRPSTYAPTISTIQKREYILKEDRPAKTRESNIITLAKGEIKEVKGVENYGAEKSKLFPTDIGVIVNNFLCQYFRDVVDYNFTADVEKEFDEVAQGKQDWRKMLDDFYKPFHAEVEKTAEVSEKTTGQRLIGVDPKSKKNVYAKIGRFGAMVQIGETTDEEKPRFAGMKKNQRIEDITLEEAISLFNLPRVVGTYESIEIIASVGRFGPFLKFGDKNISLPKGEDPMKIGQQRCIEIIQEKKIADQKKESLMSVLPKTIGQIDGKDIVLQLGRFGVYLSFDEKNYRIPKNIDAIKLDLEQAKQIVEGKQTKKALKSFDDIDVMEGRYGAYISSKGENYKIPKGVGVEDLTLELCKKIIAEAPAKKASKRAKK